MRPTRLWLLLLFHAVAGAAELPEPSVLRGWIEEMKSSARGPFVAIRWFCKDGSVLAARAPGGCAEHRGGYQHGEWSAEVKRLRDGGYFVANILADLDPAILAARPLDAEALTQVLIEQFLLAADDGWVLRRARYYRGAFQAEDDAKGTRTLLARLAAQTDWATRGFLPLRTAARLLPHREDARSWSAVRDEALALAGSDPRFQDIRIKIHNRPDPVDVARVRDYAAGVTDERFKARYLKLAADLDRLYAPAPLLPPIEALLKGVGDPGLSREVRSAADGLRVGEPLARFRATAALMAALRTHLARLPARLRVEALDLSLAAEAEHFSQASVLRSQIPQASRHERLNWLRASAQAVYGAGLISQRELRALDESFSGLDGELVGVGEYLARMDYLERLPGWCSAWMRLHFSAAMEKLAVLEPLAGRFDQEQLRASPAFFYSALIDGLLGDAQHQAGLKRELFGENVASGLRALNPGVARGRLYAGTAHGTWAADGIYLLPETTADLPPVAGILTAGHGNPLSHVQLLARNLGIPNVAIAETLIPRLRAHRMETVVLAVSPRGAVQLAPDRGDIAALLGDERGAAPRLVILPDLEKLDLATREPVPLARLRASDSGRRVGPKAAKLGELYFHYPEAGTVGLAIPFGVFRQLLDRPLAGTGQGAYDWMVSEYRRIAGLDGAARREATERLRARMEDWVRETDPGAALRARLRPAMGQVFGREGGYGVFVRSDTNVEDLPGFTGAGLNLTVPNVVGFERVMQALSDVWASPYSARAYGWRQAHMVEPQHVYTAVLLLKSVPAEKSGVLVTADVDSGDTEWLSVAVNEGVGGAVDGQLAESLRIHRATGAVRLLASATAPKKRVLLPQGGVSQVPASGAEAVLSPNEIQALRDLATGLAERFPPIVDAEGRPAPADIEFGFHKGRLVLFQIRPFLESAEARRHTYLQALDQALAGAADKRVAMAGVPGGGGH
ncbi:MAG: PEP/pyruvate-binding domain-containing protein [Gammaproteobacteria bacterium]